MFKQEDQGMEGLIRSERELKMTTSTSDQNSAETQHSSLRQNALLYNNSNN